MSEQADNQQDAWFRESLAAVQGIFEDYSPQDVLLSLSAIAWWLPNIASPTRLLFASAVVLSMPRESLAGRKSINSFADFEEFCRRLFKALPEFGGFDDFVPEPDWGDIQIMIGEQLYTLLYGSCISNVYDYVNLFIALHRPFDARYRAMMGHSAMDDLRGALTTQSRIIAGVGGQKPSESIEPGHLECPSEEFWRRTLRFASEGTWKSDLDADFLDRHSTTIGGLDRGRMEVDQQFVNDAYEGTLITAFFVKDGALTVPILPRNYIATLLAKWGTVLRDKKAELIREKESLLQKLLGELYPYVRKRIRDERLMAFVSAIGPDGPHEVVFPFAIRSKDRLALFYVVPPGLDSDSAMKHLEDVFPHLAKVPELVAKAPSQLLLRGRKERVEFHSQRDHAVGLTTSIFIVVPQIMLDTLALGFKVEPPGHVMFLDGFLGLIDELEDADELSDFADFLDELNRAKTMPLVSLLDQFGAFRDSKGVLVGGAAEFDFIGLDVHWGSRHRFISLATFWKLYPATTYFGEPRSWRVERISSSAKRLISRSEAGAAINCRVGDAEAFFTAPFGAMTYDQVRFSNFVMECLEDGFTKNADLIQDLELIRRHKNLQVTVFPASLVHENKDGRFGHVLQLIPESGLMQADSGFPAAGAIGVRVVFDDKKLVEVFSKANDSQPAAQILVWTLDALNRKAPSPKYSTVRNLLLKRIGPIRFRFSSMRRLAAFPETFRPEFAEDADFKRAKKRMAQLAKSNGMIEGHYELDAAKEKLASLKSAMVAELNQIVQGFDAARSIPILIANIDALSKDHEYDRIRAETATTHEVDFVIEDRLAESEKRFTLTHRNYRYLIEKFVQLAPKGKDVLSDKNIRAMIASVDWIHVVQGASDSLHYGISPVGVEINSEFIVDVKYHDDISKQQDAYAKEQAELQLGRIGNSDDRVRLGDPERDFVDKLDTAFEQAFGFRFRYLLNTLDVLKFWPEAVQGIPESTHYSASAEEIAEAALKFCNLNVQRLPQKEEFEKVVDFLTLKRDWLLRVLNRADPCSDLPIWEHTKRRYRYPVQPLISLGDKLVWGPFSAMKSESLWSGYLSDGSLPADFGGDGVMELLRTRKKAREDAVEEKGYEIIKRITPHIKQAAFLHRIDRDGQHPEDLGDYDVLAYVADKNVLLNIECKDLAAVYCLKDARRLRQRIFGEAGQPGHFDQINKRAAYLKKNWKRIGKLLGWPIDESKLPAIVTAYVTNRSYWWTRYPQEGVEAHFVELRLLESWARSISVSS